ncbi:amino acid adenylation domain-containing protein [Micromonospora sp. WMMD718]|uniref:amino acid adenylation domain-containing protein n=1 Tax=Micromonospora TaxID=1873 RepID=UPI002416C75E|nr:amino acid adenylation domain-containing protein [Micromonospora sp. WMMD718]MDG4755836.1 amino acid adenylation domain-containing protein [Micromonospora sp. WMMD718]
MDDQLSRLSRGLGPAAYANGDRIEQIVRHHAELTPDAVAIRQADRVLSYRDLIAMADRVACGLTKRGVGPGSVVPVCLPRSPELVGVLLGALSTGAAYLVMDPRWPAGRREYVLTASGADFLIAGDDGAPPPAGFARLTVAEVLTDGTTEPPPGLSGAQAACVFYTSGSTGQPKGVVSPHRGTVRVLVGNDDLPLDADTVFLQAAPLPWDAFSLELWAPLLNGGCCVLLDRDAPNLDVAALRDAVDRGVNSLWLTSSLFNVFVDEAVELFGDVRLVLVGGERVSVAHLRRLLDRFPELPVVNGYGPVEGTIFATTQLVHPRHVRVPATDVPIGRPVPGTGVVVVDEALRPVPAGRLGELLVSGDGLALGYLGDPESTARAFVDVDDVRHYRTGDRALFEDGVFRYRGRLDRQVKVNGVRIEPGEVEAILERHPGVRVCSVVRAGNDERPRLVALFESADPVAPTAEVLRAFVAGQLLPAMIPAVMRPVDRLPLGSTGKVDVAQVQAMAELLVREDAPKVGARAAASTEPDVPLLSATRSLLGVPDLGIDDDLFAAGATSLDAVRLASRATAMLPSPIGLTDVYRTPTVRGLLDVAVERARADVARQESSSAADAPLSHAQTRFWLAEQLNPGAADNMVVLAYLVTGDWDPRVLRMAFEDVIERHAILRTIYPPADRTAVARLVAPAPFDLEVVPAPAGEDVEAALRRLTADWWRTPFDLEAEPPFRVRVSRLGADRYLLGLHLHHIAFDGWSERILMTDLAIAYRARATDTKPVFPELPPYAAYSRMECGGTEAGADTALRQWRAVLEPPIAPAFAPPLSDSPDGPRVELDRTLPEPLVSRLRAMASRLGTPTASVLSAAVARAVARGFGVGQVCVGTVAPARRDPHFDGVLGYFVDPLPLALRTAGEPEGRPVLTEAVEQLRGAMHRPLIPFEDLVRALAPARGRHPWFQTWVVVQHEPPSGELSPHVRYRPLRLSPPSTSTELLIHAIPREEGGWDLVASCRADGIGEAALRDLVHTVTEVLTHYADEFSRS